MDKIFLVLSLVVVLQFSTAIRYEVTSPNIFRLNIPETVGVTISDHGNPIEIELFLQDHPGKTKVTSHRRFFVTPGHSEVQQLTFKANDIPELYKNDEIIFVYLVVKAVKGEFTQNEVLIPVKKYAGYAFLQTDKPLYLPKDTVNIRIIHLNQKLLPTEEKFALEINNPNGQRVLHKEMVPDVKGITETQFNFPVLPLLGNWSVSVNYGYQMTGKKVVHFDVREYVLPTFSIEIEPQKFILDTQQYIDIKVSAKYVYGKPVQGTLNLKYALRDENGAVVPIGTLEKNELDENGEYYLSLDVERHIKQRGIIWFPFIINSNLLVEAEVIEKATGHKETANDYSSIFTTSPYKISFTRSNSDFKPGVPYQLQVDVKLSSGRVAPGVAIQVLRAVVNVNSVENRKIPIPVPLKSDKLGRVMFKFGTVKTDEQLVITVGTQDKSFKDENQASGTMMVERYNSPDKTSYVWIASPTKGQISKVGQTFETDVTIYPPEENIKLYYIVTSRGMILHMDETERQAGALVRSLQFLVTPDMSPSARLIVYIVRKNFIIADSLKIEVEEKCKYNDGNELTLSAHTPSGFFKPHQTVNLKIEGEAESSVGILAVDKAIYVLNDEFLLTREQLFNELTSQDFGCGPGGGVDTEKVFMNAGILVMTSVSLHKHDRQECKPKSVKKRSLGAKVSDYSGVTAVCCHLGQLDGPPDMNCKERSAKIYKSIGDKENCSTAFFDCCEAIAKYTEEYNNLARSIFGKKLPKLEDTKIIEMKEADALNYVRWFFPENWLFRTYELGSPDCKGDNKDICEIPTSIPHSITTWSIQAVGVSHKTGMCVAKPIDLVVFRSMFIQMKLPYSAIRGEQIEIPVTIFNYDNEEIKVTAYVNGVEGLCMGAGAGERSETQVVFVPGNSATTVTFPVMPLEVADYPIKVIALSWEASDAVEKMLKVVHDGIPKETSFLVTLDPSGFIRHRRAKNMLAVDVEEIFDEQHNRQSLSIDLELPDNFIPETGRCHVSLLGDVMGQMVTIAIKGLEERFFALPSGCGEQTMITFAPLVYTMHYLKRTNKLSSNFEKTAYKLLQQGYAHLLQYRKADGSFAVWATHASSIWLTSFVAKVLCQAESFIQIPEDVRCGAIDYVVKTQKPNGAYDSTANVVHHTEITGGIQGDVTTTAFILISLMSCDKCNNVANKKVAVTKATKYLEDNIDFLNQPFALSIITYALALADSPLTTKANDKLKALSVFDEASDSRFWNWNPLEFNNGVKPWVFQHHPSALAVETTAYALLAQLHLDDIAYAHPIANWLNRQRNDKGSFVSTQDTVMALQALSEYTYRAKLPKLDMVVNISSEVSAREKRSVVLNNANALTMQEYEVAVGGKIFVDAVGVGVATMVVTLFYNIKDDTANKCKFDLEITTSEYDDNLAPPEPPSDFDKFNLLPNNIVNEITAEEDYKSKFAKNAKDQNQRETTDHVVKVDICIKYLGEYPAGMSILDVGLFTGFKPVVADLEALTNNPAVPITEYEQSDQRIVFYYDYVPNDVKTCISLRTYQDISVGKVQATTIKVYHYYEPENSCTKFYQPDGGSPMLTPICEGNQCRCLEGQCPPCSPFDIVLTRKFDADRRKELLHLACDKHDFVWSGTVKERRTEGEFVYYHFLVNYVLKEGLEKKDKVEKKVVVFTSRQLCECPSMKTGKKYIIMGTDGFSFTDADGLIGYKYLFDKRTSVYEMQKLRDLTDRDQLSLQKVFNWLLRRMTEKGRTCEH